MTGEWNSHTLLIGRESQKVVDSETIAKSKEKELKLENINMKEYLKEVIKK